MQRGGESFIEVEKLSVTLIWSGKQLIVNERKNKASLPSSTPASVMFPRAHTQFHPVFFAELKQTHSALFTRNSE
jgi:hypothetical protein